MEGKLLLAALGRGTQQLYANGPWEPTGDLEVCDEKFAHLPICVPENDDHPNSIIGGGQLNILAAAELWRQLDPAIVVFAYGNRSLHLQEYGFPSESEIMGEYFAKLIGDPAAASRLVDVFDEKEWNVGGAGTLQELHNIFSLARKRDIQNVTIVTVAVHAARVAFMVRGYSGEFGDLKISIAVSEYVLLRANPEKYADRVKRIFASQSYIRNYEREISGMNALLAGTYKPIASIRK